jgi:hypothetical protein
LIAFTKAPSTNENICADSACFSCWRKCSTRWPIFFQRDSRFLSLVLVSKKENSQI